MQALDKARIARNALDDRIRALGSDGSAAGLMRPSSAGEIRGQLATGTALLSYVQTPEGVILLAIDGASRARGSPAIAFSRVLDRDVARLKAQIEALHVLLRSHVDAPDAERALLDRLAALHATLIAPASSVLRGKRRLIIVPDGNLHRIPWATLDPTRRWWHSPLQRTRAQRAALSPQRRRMRPEES
ncbi:MAG TPA: hypothetical protein VJ011_00525 [Steroidobacteraceae bacterium]|nr:hypothetical protein [Steroidobacteraceae bacterium]